MSKPVNRAMSRTASAAVPGPLRRPLAAATAGLTALATFAAMAVFALVLALALGACAPAAEPYPVISAAELTAIAQDITGPIEILGSNVDGDETTDFQLRTLAAYRVHLPDAAPRHAVIYHATSCEVPDTRPFVFADLQTIRTVGNETHFFADDILVNGRRIDVDTETAQAELSTDPETGLDVLGKIAVVQAPDVDGTPGAWLACGVFTAVDRCVGCDGR
jgi:hypothetical protein